MSDVWVTRQVSRFNPASRTARQDEEKATKNDPGDRELISRSKKMIDRLLKLDDDEFKTQTEQMEKHARALDVPEDANPLLQLVERARFTREKHKAMARYQAEKISRIEAQIKLYSKLKDIIKYLEDEQHKINLDDHFAKIKNSPEWSKIPDVEKTELMKYIEDAKASRKARRRCEEQG